MFRSSSTRLPAARAFGPAGRAFLAASRGLLPAARAFLPAARAFLPAACAFLLSPPPGAAAQEGVRPEGPPPLFASHAPLELTLRTDLAALRGDRRGRAPERPGVVVIGGPGNGQELDVRVRTRGEFRRDPANCTFPPLRLNFRRSQVEGTVLEAQDKLKLVGSCRPRRDSYERLVLREYLAYRLFEKVSPTAYRVRLARITYVDDSGSAEPFTRFGFLIESDDAMAARLGGAVLELPERGNLPAGALDPPSAATVAVFQYMIGNTDWSDVAGHNVTLVEMLGVAVPVPYDFDFSGLVDAPYATPDPDLSLRSVRQRLYRGWCWKGLNAGRILDRFRGAEEDVRALVDTFPYMDGGERRRALRYLGPFFDEIRSDDRARRLFLRDCRPFRRAAGPGREGAPAAVRPGRLPPVGLLQDALRPPAAGGEGQTPGVLGVLGVAHEHPLVSLQPGSVLLHGAGQGIELGGHGLEASQLPLQGEAGAHPDRREDEDRARRALERPLPPPGPHPAVHGLSASSAPPGVAQAPNVS